MQKHKPRKRRLPRSEHLKDVSKYRVRVVCSKKAYTRKHKHKERELQGEEVLTKW